MPPQHLFTFLPQGFLQCHGRPHSMWQVLEGQGIWGSSYLQGHLSNKENGVCWVNIPASEDNSVACSAWCLRGSQVGLSPVAHSDHQPNDTSLISFSPSRSLSLTPAFWNHLPNKLQVPMSLLQSLLSGLPKRRFPAFFPQ